MIQAIHDIGAPATLPVVAIRTAAQIRTRNGFDEQSLTELSNSIKEAGIIEPLIVRRDPVDDSQYLLISGERRLMAATMAGLDEVPALIREADDAQAATIQAMENLQRENLDLADTAEGVAALLKHFYKSPKALAKALGKSPAWVSKHLSITKLTTSVRGLLADRLTEDPEILLGLDKIARIGSEEALKTFHRLAAGLADGKTTRTSVRNALAALKAPKSSEKGEEGEGDDDGEESGEQASDEPEEEPEYMVPLRIELRPDLAAKLKEKLGGLAWLQKEVAKLIKNAPI